MELGGVLDAYKIISHERIQVGASAVGVTPPDNCVAIQCRVGSQDSIMVSVDTVAPTASVGYPFLPYEEFIIDDRDELANFKAIRVGSTTVDLQVLYLKRKLP